MSDANRNKQIVASALQALGSGNVDAADEYIDANYIQHNPQVGNGLQAAKDFFRSVAPIEVEVHRVVAEGDIVVVHTNYKTWNMAGVDIFRVNDAGKIVEHWDVLQTIPETTASGNDLFSQLS